MRGVPSISLSLVNTNKVLVDSSCTVGVSGPPIGASLTGLTVSDTVAVAEPPAPSETV